MRGPADSSQWPKTAADEPRKTKKSVNVHPSQLIFQSQSGGDERREKAEGFRTFLRLCAADGARERQPEDGKAIGHADAEMDGERRRRDKPAIECRQCDGSLPAKKVGTGDGVGGH